MNILVFLSIQIFCLPHLSPGEVQKKPWLDPQHVFHSYILAQLSFLLLLFFLKCLGNGNIEALRGLEQVWRMCMSRARRIKTFNHFLGTLDRMSTSLRDWNQLQVPTPGQTSKPLRASASFCHIWEWAITGWLHVGSASCPPQKSLLRPSSTHPAPGPFLGSAPGWLSEHPCAAVPHLHTQGSPRPHLYFRNANFSNYRPVAISQSTPSLRLVIGLWMSGWIFPNCP